MPPGLRGSGYHHGIGHIAGGSGRSLIIHNTCIRFPVQIIKIRIKCLRTVKNDNNNLMWFCMRLHIFFYTTNTGLYFFCASSSVSKP